MKWRGATKPILRGAARGFSLLIMLAAIALLGVFAVVATRLMKTTLDLYREAGRIDTDVRLTDAAMRQLRQDVWTARQVASDAPKQLTIDHGAAGSVSWRVEPDGALVRTEAAPSTALRRWSSVGGRVSFEWDGTALAVRGADRGADRAGGVRMVSQWRIAEAGVAR